MWRLLLGAAALRSAAAVRVGNASGWPSVVPEHPVPETLGWSEYKRTFAKAYIDGADEAMRRAAFEENVRLIRQLNAEHDAGRHSFRCGVNQYSDMGHDEFVERLLGSGPAMAEAAAAHASLPEAPLAADPPPASVDWQAKGAVGPVKDRKQAKPARAARLCSPPLRRLCSSSSSSTH